jgi:hypothetical protein
VELNIETNKEIDIISKLEEGMEEPISGPKTRRK